MQIIKISVVFLKNFLFIKLIIKKIMKPTTERTKMNRPTPLTISNPSSTLEAKTKVGIVKDKMDKTMILSCNSYFFNIYTLFLFNLFR